MRQFLTLTFVLLLAASCTTTYEKADLYGHWKNNKWEFVFNEDKTCKVGTEGEFLPGTWTYTAFGNTLELVKDGRVFLGNLTVKGIENDELTLEFRDIGDKNGMDDIQVLKRVN